MWQIVVQFIPTLLSGFLVNLEIGVFVVGVAVLLGVPLSLVRRSGSFMGRPVTACLQLMQALPTYVVMFFVLNLLPRDMSLFGSSITGIASVVIAQSVYLTAYVAEDAYEALGHLAQRDYDRALLFLPNLLRGFVVVVMSSGFGAAVGVSEAVSATIRQAERLPPIGDRVVLFSITIIFFAVVFGSLNAIIRSMIGRLGRPGASSPTQVMPAVHGVGK